MRKISILFLALSSTVGVMAQQKSSYPNTKGETNKVKVVQDKAGTTQSVTGTPTLSNSKTRASWPALVGTKEIVGRTAYDLQTNGSMPRRILENGNNISCFWTFSNISSPTSTSGYSDRGTGYATFNGTSWSAAPTARIEPTRTGFGSASLNSAGTEIYVAHDSVQKLQISKKTSGTWSTAQSTTSGVSTAMWPHSASAGNWLYVIAASQDSSTKSNGIRNGYFFSRSNDNGATWIDNMIPMPNIDSVTNYRGGGNSYSISATGSNVAILFGDVGVDLTLLSSNDNGATWTKKTIWDWPIDNYDFAGTAITDYNNDTVVDTLWTNDGSHSLTLASNGDVHIAFPLIRVYKSGTTGYGFFYSTYLAYYNSIADSVVTIDNTFDHLCGTGTTFGLGASYSTTADGDAMYYTIGTTSMPSISVVEGTTNKVLIAYTSIVGGDTTVDDPDHPYWNGTNAIPGQNYRDVYVMASGDNGATWGWPVNVSKSAHFEEAYVSTPERITGSKFNILYQGDIEPGTIMGSKDFYDNEFQNAQIVQQISIADIMTLSLDSTSMCGQQEMPVGVKNILTGQEGLVKVYPNPTSNTLNVSMSLINNSKNVNISIYDVTGKIVYNSNLANVTSSVQKISVENLINGMYMVRVTTDAGAVTKSFIKD